jgi:hypothetical protein
MPTAGDGPGGNSPSPQWLARGKPTIEGRTGGSAPRASATVSRKSQPRRIIPSSAVPAASRASSAISTSSGWLAGARLSGSSACPEAAVGVLVAAQALDDGIGRLVLEQDGEQPTLEQPTRAVDEVAPTREERVVHVLDDTSRTRGVNPPLVAALADQAEPARPAVISRRGNGGSERRAGRDLRC